MISIFLMKNFKYTEKAKWFYSEYLYTYYLNSTINILLYLFYYVSTYIKFFLKSEILFCGVVASYCDNAWF